MFYMSRSFAKFSGFGVQEAHMAEYRTISAPEAHSVIQLTTGDRPRHIKKKIKRLLFQVYRTLLFG